jgi:hypothetical protein
LHSVFNGASPLDSRAYGLPESSGTEGLYQESPYPHRQLTGNRGNPVFVYH